MVTTPARMNFLYRLEAGSSVYRFTDVAESQTYNDEVYDYIPIQHTAPKFSGEVQDAEIDITVWEANAITDLFVNGPPAYSIKVIIYEYDRVANTATPYYRGWTVRPSFNLGDSIVVFHCKTVWHYFERQSFVDSLAALSRYSVYDPRSGVDIESFRVPVVVTGMNDERDELTVSGITQIDDYFTAGLIIASDRDMRTILKQTGGVLTLNAAFPLFTMATGYSADIYPGDNLAYDTWANKFAAVTNNGEAFGGWPFMPNVDPLVRGVI